MLILLNVERGDRMSLNLSFPYIRNHIPLTTPHRRRPGTRITPQSITIHSTANPNSTAINERNWLVNPSNTRTASWHIAVDDRQAVEAIPLNEVAYHAGDATGNRTSIGIEICESGDRQKTLRNAIQLTAALLKERNWGINRLKRHFDWSGKHCPRILMANNWAGWKNFLQEVGKELKPPKPLPQIQDRVGLVFRGTRVTDFDAYLIDSTTYVPLRFLSERLGARIRWDNETRTAHVD